MRESGTPIAPDERPADPQKFYEVGSTAFFALSSDQRFSYTLYVPRSVINNTEAAPVAVLVHDTMRTVEHYRSSFAEWAEHNGVVLFLPLFPAGIPQPWDLHAYKYLATGGVRYDLILLEMLAEAAPRFGFCPARFLLFGFSGGGQYVHRFALLHPDRVRAVSIGAPGGVTRVDTSRPWWVGTSDVEQIFGQTVPVRSLAAMQAQTVIGSADTDTWEVSGPQVRSSPYHMDGADDAGRNRRERIAALAENLRSHGVVVDEHVEPGIGHDPTPLFPAVQTYFSRVLERDRSTGHTMAPSTSESV